MTYEQLPLSAETKKEISVILAVRNEEHAWVH
jgi:hypothetical protein